MRGSHTVSRPTLVREEAILAPGLREEPLSAGMSFADSGGDLVCRNIKPLFNFDPPASDAEIREASLQFVRKISGFSKPSRINEEAFHRGVEEVAAAARTLLDSLTTEAEPRNRETEVARARARAVERFGVVPARLHQTPRNP